MLYHAEHTKGMWAEACSHAAYILNRLPTSATNASPYKTWHGRDPDLMHLRVWGCIGYAQVPEGQRTKLDAKAEPCRLLGFDPGVKAYKVLLLNSNRVTFRRDVTFEEERFHLPSKRKQQKDTKNSAQAQSTPTIAVDINLGEPEQRIDAEEEQPPDTVDPQAQVQHQEDVEVIPLATLHQAPRQSPRVRRPPRRFSPDDYATGAEDERNNYEYAFLAHQSEDEPRTYAEATRSPQADKWRAAAAEELQALAMHKTWELVDLYHQAASPLGADGFSGSNSITGYNYINLMSRRPFCMAALKKRSTCNNQRDLTISQAASADSGEASMD